MIRNVCESVKVVFLQSIRTKCFVIRLAIFCCAMTRHAFSILIQQFKQVDTWHFSFFHYC